MSGRLKNTRNKDNGVQKKLDSERKYILIAENAADFVATMNFQGAYTYISPSHKKFGYGEEDLLGKCAFDFIHPEDNLKLFPLFAKYASMKIQQLMVLKKELVSQGLTFRFPDKQGNWHWMEAAASLVDSPDGKGLNALLVSRDITERRLMEEQLKESEERYRALIELGTEAGEAIIMIQNIDGKEGIQTFVNDHWTAITGYARRELLGTSFFNLVDSQDRKASVERYLYRISGKPLPGMFEMNIVRKDGTPLPVEFTGAFTTYQGKRAVVLYLRDISMRKQHETELKKSREHFSSLFDELPIAIWDLDYSPIKKYIDSLRDKGIRDFRRYFDENSDEVMHCLMLEGGGNSYINKATLTIWEADSMEQMQQGIFDLISKRPAGLSYDKENILSMIEGKVENSYDCYDLTFKGNWKHLHSIWRIAPGHEKDWGRVYHLFYDITERKKAEEEIMHLNRLYGVVSHVNQAVVRISHKTGMLDTVCRILVEQGGLRLAWIGQIEQGKGGVVPAAIFTASDIFQRAFGSHTYEYRPDCRGPIAGCMQERRAVVVRNIFDDPSVEHIRAKASAFGLCSLGAFPIFLRDQVWGVLCVYSDTAGYFGAREIKLLEEVTGDIGFALDNYEKEEQRKRAGEAVKMNEARLDSLRKISEYRAESQQQLLEFALDEAMQLTGSRIGSIFLYDEDSKELTLNAWADDTNLADEQSDKKHVYHIEQAGIWGESIRQRRPVIYNECLISNPQDSGLPAMSARITRLLSVPVSMQNKIVAIANFANKETCYTHADMRQMSLLMDSVWKVFEHMTAGMIIKASLIEKELLLKEIHHRVKNNMQVISSLLEMQSGFVVDKEDAQMFHESQQRINSMSLVYNKLYQSADLASIGFSEYVNSLVSNLLESYAFDKDNITTSIKVVDIEMGIDLAIPCGLIINEVITNSLKYAFPENRKGRIWIDLRQKEGQITMILGDDGTGIPDGIDFTTTKTLGMTLIQTLVVQQLNGTIELKRRGGTEYIIQFRR